MRWHEITIHTTEQAIEMITNFVHELGAGGVSIEESGTLNKERDTSLGQWYELPLNDIPEGRAVIKGYFPEVADVQHLMSQLHKSIEQLAEFQIDTGHPTIEAQIVDDEDWANAWKQYFKPIRVSERLTIKPTWETYEPTEDELIIELDPGMAFGTGTHATTSLCLRSLEEIVQNDDDVIDVGTGSGILAIAAAKLGAKRVLALDLDPVAVSSATENVRLNGLDKLIAVQQSDLLQVIRTSEVESEVESGANGHRSGQELGVELPVRIVVANILAEIIMLFIEDVYEALQPGGYYLASGIIGAKEDDVKKALVATGFTIVKVNKDQDWVAIIARK